MSKIMIYSPKGGVGKTSLSIILQQIMKDSQIITNDQMNPYSMVLDKKMYHLVEDDQEIPSFNDYDGSLIFDFAGMIDDRIPSFVRNTKDLLILIPFNPDVVSFQSALRLFNEIKEYNENIIFVLNKSKKGDYEIFSNQMKKMKINKSLLEVKESKLFNNIFNKGQTIDGVNNDKLLSHSYKNVLKQVNELCKELKK